MSRKKRKQSPPLEARQEDLDAWKQLPQGTPSREALPPAGDGLGAFFRLFAPLFGWARRHPRRAIAAGGVLLVVIGVMLRL